MEALLAPVRRLFAAPQVDMRLEVLLKYREEIQALRNRMRIIEANSENYLADEFWLHYREQMNMLIREAKLMLKGSNEPVMK